MRLLKCKINLVFLLHNLIHLKSTGIIKRQMILNNQNHYIKLRHSAKLRQNGIDMSACIRLKDNSRWDQMELIRVLESDSKTTLRHPLTDNELYCLQQSLCLTFQNWHMLFIWHRLSVKKVPMWIAHTKSQRYAYVGYIKCDINDAFEPSHRQSLPLIWSWNESRFLSHVGDDVVGKSLHATASKHLTQLYQYHK